MPNTRLAPAYALVLHGGVVAGQRPRTGLACLMDIINPETLPALMDGSLPATVKVWFDGNKRPTKVPGHYILATFSCRPTEAQVKSARAALKPVPPCEHGYAKGRCYSCSNTPHSVKDLLQVKPERPPADFHVENHGTIFLLRPLSDSARAWVAEHIPEDAQRWGEAVVVEHRYIQDIVEGARNDGLEVI